MARSQFFSNFLLIHSDQTGFFFNSREALLCTSPVSMLRVLARPIARAASRAGVAERGVFRSDGTAELATCGTDVGLFSVVFPPCASFRGPTLQSASLRSVGAWMDACRARCTCMCGADERCFGLFVAALSRYSRLLCTATMATELISFKRGDGSEVALPSALLYSTLETCF